MNDHTTEPASDFAILYVDDEEMALKYFRRAVGNDFTVHTAGDVPEGLAVLEEMGDRIGVLITDQRMPGQSGVDLLKKVRERWPHIVRLLTTAYADLEDAIEAVNRGEIFRYITKPWDIKALRSEIKQSMEIFRLRYEHAALMQEKLSVWQRLIQLGRIRDLIVMGGSFAHLRHSDAAVAAFLNDHLRSDDRDVADSRHLDLWGLTEAEIQRTLAFVDTVLGRTRLETAAPEPLSARELIALGGEPLGDVSGQEDTSLPEVRLERASAGRLLHELAAIRASVSEPNRHAHIARGETAGGSTGLVVELPAPGEDNGVLTSSERAGTLIAYLLAYHLGGSLTRGHGGEGSVYRLALPENQDAAHVDTPRPGWLENLLVRLESWD